MFLNNRCIVLQTTGGLFEILEEFSPDNKSLLIASKSTKLLPPCDEVLSIIIILLSFEAANNSFSKKGSTTVSFYSECPHTEVHSDLTKVYYKLWLKY